MWKSNIMKLADRLNSYLNATRVGNVRFVRGLKHRGKQVIIRLLTHDNLLLIKVHGLAMYIYPNTADTRAYLLGPFEPYTTELFKRAIRAGAMVLDIGAQFGYFSLIAAKRAGQKGAVYAFEPVPANFRLLEENIRMNNLSGLVHPVQKAVGDKHTTVTLCLYEGSDSHGMYRHPQASVKGTLQVECIAIDQFLGERSVDVIKMDIEGSEPYALEGMKQTVSRSHNLILFTELAPAYLRRAGVEPADYLTQLRRLGFHVQLIDEHSRCLKPVSKHFLAGDDPSWYANLYCTKR